jgi:TolA-binding protein
MKHDAFVDEVGVVYEGFRRNATRFVGAIAGVIAIFAIVYGFYAYRGHKEKVAQGKLADAIAIMNEPAGETAPQPGMPAPKYKSEGEKATKAEPIFAEVSKNYSGTDAADVADVYLARMEAARGDVAGAEKRLDEFVSDHPKNIIGIAARMSLFDLKLANGQGNEVVASLEKELRDPKSLLPKDAVLATLAKAYEQTNQPAKARETYQRIVNEYPESPYAAEVQRTMPQG